MKRYQSFTEIVQDASDLCLVWRDLQGKTVTILELMDSMEKNPDLEPPKAYMLSEEGAIGATDRYEYSTGWILFPMEEGPEKEACLERLRSYFKGETKSGVRYCKYCGAELPEEARFCMKCGKPQD